MVKMQQYAVAHVFWQRGEIVPAWISIEEFDVGDWYGNKFIIASRAKSVKVALNGCYPVAQGKHAPLHSRAKRHIIFHCTNTLLRHDVDPLVLAPFTPAHVYPVYAESTHSNKKLTRATGRAWAQRLESGLRAAPSVG
ncbi:hypothetical protein diail_2160 [Diaporthe ilicicola]|nr:hypothetical protein diail_2160 [Diaporthe ilicicola]